MALIQCPECSREVSERAVACPDCGFPIAAECDQEQGGAALVAGKERPVGALEVAGERTARIMRTEVAQPLVEVQQARMKQEQDKASGCSWGAFFGALVGLVLFFAACVPGNPKIQSVSPPSGVTTGGDTVRIKVVGLDLDAGCKVLFGGLEVQSMEVLSPTQVQVVTPRMSTSGAVDVRIVQTDTGDGEVNAVRRDGYSYQQPAATLAELTRSIASVGEEATIVALRSRGVSDTAVLRSGSELVKNVGGREVVFDIEPRLDAPRGSVVTFSARYTEPTGAFETDQNLSQVRAHSIEKPKRGHRRVLAEGEGDLLERHELYKRSQREGWCISTEGCQDGYACGQPVSVLAVTSYQMRAVGGGRQWPWEDEEVRSSICSSPICREGHKNGMRIIEGNMKRMPTMDVRRFRVDFEPLP